MRKLDQTAIIQATKSRDLAQVSELVRCGIMTKAINCIAKALKKIPKTPVTVTDKQGNTALFWATREGAIAIMQLLLQAKAEINHANRDGVTALHWAAKFNQGAAAKLLIDHKANINATPCDVNSTASASRKMTPLFTAAARVDSENKSSPAMDVVKLLLTVKADPTIYPQGNLAPLHFIAAVSQDDRLIARLLLLGARVCTPIPELSDQQALYFTAKRNMTIFQYSKTLHRDFLPQLSSPITTIIAGYAITETATDRYDDRHGLIL